MRAFELPDFFEGVSVFERDGLYYLIYAQNCGAITAENRTPKRFAYAVSDKIDGEYRYRGMFLTNEFYPNSVNIHGSVRKCFGQWYCFYHKPLNGIWNHRSLCIEKIDFEENGNIKPLKMTSHGASDGLDTKKYIYANTATEFTNCVMQDDHFVKMQPGSRLGFEDVNFKGNEKYLLISGRFCPNGRIDVLADDNLKSEVLKLTEDRCIIQWKKTDKNSCLLSVLSDSEIEIEKLLFCEKLS